MATRISKAPVRRQLTLDVMKLGAIPGADSFHVYIHDRLIRMSTRPMCSAADLQEDPEALTAWTDPRLGVLAIRQKDLAERCQAKPSWKRKGQYNVPTDSVPQIVYPILELL
jgi:hypothetical protein